MSRAEYTPFAISMARAFFVVVGAVLLIAGGSAALLSLGPVAVGGAIAGFFGACILMFGLLASSRTCGNAADWFLTIMGV